ncbi:hypothetical protein [Mucilaginibacter humi]|uniref:hypothetical protein n=1 Tax=Mucilaginibacter humi TaxID=2732510 RepID=UPI001FE762AD|nr:hypothetical protein [Mucilaginibacter humi]
MPQIDTNIPTSLYEQLNVKQSVFKKKELVLEPALTTTAATVATTEPAPIRKPMFKPTFKKPADE